MAFPSWDGVANFASSLVATAPSTPTAGTSLVVTATQGALFPAVPFDAVIWPANQQPSAATSEICRVTNISTDTFTIVRGPNPGSDGDTGGINRTVLVGDNIAATITAKTITDLQGRPDTAVRQFLTTAVSTSTTTVISTGLTFNIGSNQVYTFDAEIGTKSSVTSTTGVVFAISAPVGATGMWAAMGVSRPAAAGTTSALEQGTATTLTTGTTIGIFNASTATGAVFIQGNISCATTSGAVTLYYGSSATTATVTINALSNFLAFRLA